MSVETVVTFSRIGENIGRTQRELQQGGQNVIGYVEINDPNSPPNICTVDPRSKLYIAGLSRLIQYEGENRVVAVHHTPGSLDSGTGLFLSRVCLINDVPCYEIDYPYTDQILNSEGEIS